MANLGVNSGEKQRKMPRGKPFAKNDIRINRKGAPVRGQSWQETIKRITEMTREEAINYVGINTKIGKLLKELPENLPIKDAIVFSTIIAYGREPNARMLATLMDRAEGKVADVVKGAGEGGEHIIRFIDETVKKEVNADN